MLRLAARDREQAARVKDAAAVGVGAADGGGGGAAAAAAVEESREQLAQPRL